MTDNYEDIFSSDSSNEKVEVLSVEEPPKKEKKKFNFKIDFDLKKDKILFLQVLLIGVWAILTVIIYFFGFPLFEPFINV